VFESPRARLAKRLRRGFRRVRGLVHSGRVMLWERSSGAILYQSDAVVGVARPLLSRASVRSAIDEISDRGGESTF
jgi:hypothetical protein